MDEPQAAGSRRRRALWVALALTLFGVGGVALFAPVWADGVRRAVPAPFPPDAAATDRVERLIPLEGGLFRARRSLAAADQLFAVWAVAEGAEALRAHPLRPFDTAACHPARSARALGHPILTHGLLGLPVWWLTGDPVATYNAVLVAVVWIGAAAMALLVSAWTGLPAAGIAAGLLYAFAPSHMGLAAYPFLFDTTWTVLALLFAQRFFAGGRWRDAVAVAVCCACQIALSFYTLLAAALLAVPLLVWLFAAYGTAHLRPAPCAAAVAGVLAALLAVMLPYLAPSETPALAPGAIQLFATWSGLLPGRWLAWPLALLALLGLVLPRRRGAGGLDADPRWALLAGAVLVALTAAGGNHWALAEARHVGEPPPPALPDLFAALAAVLPGLDAVRGPALVASGIHLAASVLAGFGAAALVRLAPDRLADPAAAVLVLVVALWVLPIGAGRSFAARAVRPDEATLDFFRELEHEGNAGPLFEVPIDLDSTAYLLVEASQRTLLATYHRRRTSACYNAKAPLEARRLEALGRALPGERALSDLRELGFTTIVAHESGSGALREPLAKAAAAGAGLRRLHEGAAMTAYAIEP